MFFIDMAVPRDIDPDANEIDNVYVYDIDDLNNVIETNLEERQREAALAEEIVVAEVAGFRRWLDCSRSPRRSSPCGGSSTRCGRRRSPRRSPRWGRPTRRRGRWS